MDKLEKYNAKLFIFCFPFKMFAPLWFLNGITFELGSEASFLFLAFGLLLIVIRGKLFIGNCDSDKLLKRFIIMYLICDITSVVMSMILNIEFDAIGGESPIFAASKKVLYSLAYVLFIIYCREIGRILSIEEIFKTIEVCLNFCIIIALIQIGILYNIEILEKIYDGMNSIFNAWPSYYIHHTKRIALLANEPAYSAGFIGIIIFPYLISKIMTKNDTWKDYLKLVLYLLIVYFTKSTTGYVILLFTLVIFIFNSLKKTIQDGISMNLIVGIASISLLVLIVFSLDTGVIHNVQQTLDKLSSSNPNSTDRKLITYINLRILMRYPLFGVGNGNQGFFYQELAPSWAFDSYTSRASYHRASEVLYDGGAFWPAFISGYGLFGVILLLSFLYKSIKLMYRFRNDFKMLYYFYSFSLPIIIVDGIAATLGEKQYFWFVLAIPMMLKYFVSKEQYGTKYILMHRR